MDRFNRVGMSLIALLALAGAVVVVLVTSGAVDPDFLPGGSGTDSWFYSQLLDISQFGALGTSLTLLIAVLVGVVALVLLAVEARSGRQRSRPLLISRTPEGAATIETDSVSLLSERTALINRQVLSIRCHIRLRQGGVLPSGLVIDCYPRMVMGSNVMEVRDDLQVRIKQVVEQLLGLEVAQVHLLKVRLVPGDERRLLAA